MMTRSDLSSSVGLRDSAETLPLLLRLKFTPRAVAWVGDWGFGGSSSAENPTFFFSEKKKRRRKKRRKGEEKRKEKGSGREIRHINEFQI